jgi:hypothetical protein
MLITGAYLFCHSAYGIPEPEYEYTSLNNAQIRQVNRILTSTSAPISVPNSIAGKLVDSGITISGPTHELDNMQAGSLCDAPCRIDKALFYINTEFDNKIPGDQLQTLQQYLATFNQQEAGIFLADYKFKVRSTFWLTGPLIYLESIFWVFAGVLCSLLFSVATILANKGSRYFDNKLIMSQIAKLFYAPFIALMLLMAYNYISKSISLNNHVGQGMLIFAFVVGFFSGRLMNFFTGFKNLLLPDRQQMTMATAMPAATETVIIHEPVVEEPILNTEPETEVVATPEPEEVVIPVAKKNDEGAIDVEVEVKLDATGLYDDEKNDILNKGFAGAIVTLHNVNGKDIIAAKKVMGKPGQFLATNVKPGIYIARATLSMRLVDEEIVNLFGERTSYLTPDKEGVELYVRKYNMAD